MTKLIFVIYVKYKKLCSTILFPSANKNKKIFRLTLYKNKTREDKNARLAKNNVIN